MKYIILLINLLVLVYSASYAFSKTSIPGLYSTGVDDNLNLLAGNETDPHYSLIVSPDKMFPGPDSKVVYPENYPMNVWIRNNEHSKWISPRSDAGLSNKPGVYVYRISFDLSKFKTNSAVVSGLWSTDDNGMDILINGKRTFNYTPFAAFYGMYPFVISEGFKEGINTIDFIVHNVVSSSGLRVEIYGEADPKEYVLN